ncbi:hypothetical protein F1654_11490 [Alkalicaulis satelles]|uniref:Uncharacterized protein n=1 Tax=Alkalicaulis satelles TaxID=2609175 RepID=A0A5M6ZDP8_9PROT|nr:hypothetical protein [Alkalicaulis satelles]KAA5802435.1 hypothetical protein F1654_11490 [Alkalicaulis satelles]
MSVMPMAFDRKRYTVWTWRHPLILHWILNPGLAFNELVLGQRQPAVTLIDRASAKAFIERQYVPCPTCGAHNHGLVYAKTAMGNYAGLVCAECGAAIPTLKNALTWLVLMLTWPLWKPLERRFGPGLRARQFAKLQAAKTDLQPQINRASGVRMGLYFGSVMGLVYIVMSLAMGLDWNAGLLTGGLAGLAAGILFGVTMKLFLSFKERSGPDQAGGG